MESTEQSLKEETTNASKIMQMMDEVDIKELYTKLSKINAVKNPGGIKDSFSQHCLPKELFYNYVTQDPSTWPTQNQIDVFMSEVSEQTKYCKSNIDEEKALLEKDFIPLVLDSHKMRQEKMTELKEKMVQRDAKRAKLLELKKKLNSTQVQEVQSLPDNIKEATAEQKLVLTKVNLEVESCQTAIAKAKTQNAKVKDATATVAAEITKVSEEKKKIQCILAKKKSCLQQKIDLDTSLLEYIRPLSGIRSLPVEDQNSIRCEFLSGQDGDPTLILTMYLDVNDTGHIYLKKAEVNLESLPVDDLISVGLQRNDPILLVNSLKCRWTTYQPIVREMKKLSDRYAVDWIQDKGLVRVLMGKKATVMCTLSIPKSYPAEGKVSLVNICGSHIQDFDINCVAVPGRGSLEDWMDYLEDKYGNL